ncbi:hypothetical protein QRN89_25595 [Streptomyces chengbuensis]|uniref:hypothetical protein n=1 Tax=Streptomyces TaxID=1883 RepID=UPI0025B2C9EB|nr:hypothetical protein [Streptomyces sp. HUAS CB01]WJY52891.1 hypothetical protein QRN89_25595 [Streptomyces sp. HUAS CB01]
MSWDEWEQLKTQAAGRQSDQMQLNRVPDEGGGGGGGSYGDLRASETDLAKIGTNAFKLFNRLWDEARVAGPSSSKAAEDLKTQGFELGAGLAHVAKRWDEQLGSLRDACSHISNHMRVTKKIHKDDEHYITGQLSSIATLDSGFDERVGEPGAKNKIYGDNKKDEKDKD